jgi:hypothetical protein
MVVGIEALEADVGLGLFILQELDAVGDQPSSELMDFLRSLHLEAEVREARGSLGGLIGAECQREPLGVADDDDPIRIRASCRRIEAEVPGVELDGPLLIANGQRQVVQFHSTNATGAEAFRRIGLDGVPGHGGVGVDEHLGPGETTPGEKHNNWGARLIVDAASAWVRHVEPGYV